MFKLFHRSNKAPPIIRQPTVNRGDWQLFVIPLLLSLFGLLMIYEASSIMAIEFFNNRLYFFNKQSLWLILSVISFALVSRLNIILLKKYCLPIFIGSLALLILVLIPGVGAEFLGGRRWLVFGGIVVQPSEIVKISLSIYLASLLAKTKDKKIIGSLILLVGGLIMLEPDMGTTFIVIGLAGIVYFVGGASKKDLVSLIASGLLAISLLVLVSPYRLTRLKTYLQPFKDTQGSSYHLKQVTIALGNGGWFGQGLGMSKQKYLYIPEVTTDSIFAIVGEEFGFTGVLVVLSVFGYYFYRTYRHLARQTNSFYLLLGTGLLSSIALQAVINLSAMSGLVPLTGIPLPFISYGGTALLINFTSAGLLYNISRGNNT